MFDVTHFFAILAAVVLTAAFPVIHVEPRLSPMREGDNPPLDNSVAPSTMLAIGVVLAIFILMLVALYQLRHWPPVARYILRNQRSQPPVYVRRMSTGLLLRPIKSSSASTMTMVDKPMSSSPLRSSCTRSLCALLPRSHPELADIPRTSTSSLLWKMHPSLNAVVSFASSSK
ncbi:hypothetical protein D9615_002780 [Tricholomella constricta]|uniref:Uncharacterized protein n=1 Tax=Tricholomella constricta TaxID=117010 RepID=A0A8H5M620_9AGAR|nr:hypothetical protein D9615_002780 [Tricholomella constricta]